MPYFEHRRTLCMISTLVLKYTNPKKVMKYTENFLFDHSPQTTIEEYFITYYDL